MSAKFYYFAATGRGQQIRLALAAAGIDYEEINPGAFPPTQEDKDTWQAIGGNTTTNVPMLQLADGKAFTQSSAVLRAVARLGGLMPPADDDDKMYRTDKLIADADDLRNEAYKTFVNWGLPQEAADAFISTVLPCHLGNLERQLIEGGNDFFVGEELTIADVTVYDAVTTFGSGRVPGDALADFPHLKALIGRVEESPKIKAFLAGPHYAALMKFGPETLGK